MSVCVRACAGALTVSEDNVVGIVIGLWAELSGFRFPAGGRGLFLLQNIHTCTGVDLAYY